MLPPLFFTLKETLLSILFNPPDRLGICGNAVISPSSLITPPAVLGRVSALFRLKLTGKVPTLCNTGGPVADRLVDGTWLVEGRPLVGFPWKRGENVIGAVEVVPIVVVDGAIDGAVMDGAVEGRGMAERDGFR
jgi:hypothetical protein